MANEKLARRYATAIFGLASERGIADRVGDELSSVWSTLLGNADLAEFFASPVIERPRKERVLVETLDGKLDEVSLHALLLLVRKRREVLLREVVEQYRVLQQRARGAEPLSIISAKELPPEELRSIVQRLERTYSKRFEASVTVDPSLIGGVRITMGDRRVDGTVSGRLEELSRTLFANA